MLSLSPRRDDLSGGAGLAQLLQASGTQEADIAGLRHDVGKMVLTSVVPEAAAEAVSFARSRRLRGIRA